eukprot:6504757-Alexandrium_andersonii.AAC.1
MPGPPSPPWPSRSAGSSRGGSGRASSPMLLRPNGVGASGCKSGKTGTGGKGRAAKLDRLGGGAKLVDTHAP